MKQHDPILAMLTRVTLAERSHVARLRKIGRKARAKARDLERREARVRKQFNRAAEAFA